MSGRNEIAMNNASSQEIKLHVLRIRTNYNYPAWFENTLDWANEGKITSKQLYQSFDDLSKRGLATLKTGTPTPTKPTLIPNPNAPAYVRPTFAHDTDQYGYDYLYGERDFKSDQDIWTRFSEDLTRHEGQESRITDAYKHRLSIESKVDTGQQALWDSITKLHTKHTDQETRITRNAEMIGNKSDKGHKHKCEGKECEDCGWFGEKCWFPEFEIPTWLKLLGAAIGIGLLLWLIRPLLKIGANVTK